MRTNTQGRTWTIRSGADFGRAIADVRALRGLTQEALAEQTGTSRTYLARIEAGMTVAMVERVLRILRRMGAEVSVSMRSPDERAG
jgi:transcriptional regulator with XRE-family HTH domain